MANNPMTYTQISAILNGIVEQATGVKQIAPVNTGEFVSVAQTALKMGVDPIMQSISQVLARTVFVVRPYTRKFRGLNVDRQKFGAYTRKLQISDSDFTNDVSYELKDGQSVDMYKIRKNKVLQTNYYGQVVFEKQYTTYKDQLDSAFRSPEELGMFWNMLVQNISDLIEQGHEELARAVICNVIAGKTVCDPGSCIHLLTEYNSVTGQELTESELMQSENYGNFVKWAYSRIASICAMMTERTVKFQVSVDGYRTPHHTPYNKQRIYLYAPEQYAIDSRIRSDLYNNSYLRLAYNEAVNFWQSVDSPSEILVKPVYLQTNGEITNGEETNVKKVFGLIMDEETAGYTVVNEWMSTTPLNSKGGYWNTFMHYTDRYLTDFTEKAVVLLLD